MPFYHVKGIKTEYTKNNILANDRKDVIKKLKERYGYNYEAIIIQEIKEDTDES